MIIGNWITVHWHGTRRKWKYPANEPKYHRPQIVKLFLYFPICREGTYSSQWQGINQIEHTKAGLEIKMLATININKVCALWGPEIWLSFECLCVITKRFNRLTRCWCNVHDAVLVVRILVFTGWTKLGLRNVIENELNRLIIHQI